MAFEQPRIRRFDQAHVTDNAVDDAYWTQTDTVAQPKVVRAITRRPKNRAPAINPDVAEPAVASSVCPHDMLSTTVLPVAPPADATPAKAPLTSRGLSVVLPAWNEEENIAETVETVVAVLGELAPDFEVIVVDDGSTDRTGAIAEELSARDSRVRVIHNRPNQGYGGALATGFGAARKELLFFMDSDGQFDINDIADLIVPFERGEGEVVLGYRAHRQDPPIRKLNAWAWKQMVSLLFQFRVKDIDCAFKLMPTAMMRQADVRSRGAMINTEFLAKFARMGARVTQVPVRHLPRQKGTATGANLTVIARAFRELFTLAEHVRTWAPPGDDTTPPDQPGAGGMTRDEMAAWLDDQAAHAHDARLDTDYAEAASRPRTLDGQQIVTYSTLPASDSASRTITSGQTRTLLALAIGWIAGLWLWGMPVLVVTIAAITVVYLGDLLLTLLLALRTINTSPEVRIDDGLIRSLGCHDWPRYTILCPLYRETEVVPQFVSAMQAMDYPRDRLQILFLTEEDDQATRDAIAALELPEHYTIVTVPDGQPRTKPRACNYGLLGATGEYVVIYDAEDVPDPLQLKKAVLAFAQSPEDVACVQAKLNFYNPGQNVLTRWFTTEYSLWFDLTLPGLQWARGALPLGGTSNHFRAALLRQVGAWDPFNVTEDCDLGLRLSHKRLRTVILDSTTMEEANSQAKNWVRQRSRWIKGYLQTYLVHMRQPWRYLGEGRLRDFASLQVVVGGRSATLFVNPLMWLLLAAYVALRPIVGPTFHELYPAAVFYTGMSCLIFGNFIYIYSYLVACARRRQFDLMIWALCVPVYWAMMSVAASIALYQLIYAPFYWEKTQHGLHLRAARPARPARLGAAIERYAQSGARALPIFTSMKK